MKNSIAHSSCGSYFFNPKTGHVAGDGFYGDYRIIKFDVRENEAYRKEPIRPDLDILDLGYWCVHRKDTTNTVLFEEPAWDWRDDIAFMEQEIAALDQVRAA